MKAIRDVYGETLVELAKDNDRIVVLDADVSGSTKSGIFGKAYPERFYNKGIADLPVTAADHGAGSSGHLYLARVFQKDGSPVDEAERNRMITALAERGVASNVHYKPLPMHSAYRSLGFCMEDYPNAYRQYQNEITLPLHTLLRDEDVEYVLDCFRQCLADGS